MSEVEEIGGELVAPDELGLERLRRRPIIDRMDQRQLTLIKATLALSESPEFPITDAEVGHFLELCAAYGLDPFAREAWIAKSKTGKLLIMVGRAGLRKVVNRNGMKMRSAVIYAKDHFTTEFIDNPVDAKDEEWDAHGRMPFHRITHRSTGIGEAARGPVAGAWAVVRDGSNVERGYFDAPISEYKPANASAYSPWSKQVSAMMRGAVERQAASEATPLGGIVAEGEDESERAPRLVGSAGSADPEWSGWEGLSPERAENCELVVTAAKAVGHAGLADRHSVLMRVQGMTDAAFNAWMDEAQAELDVVLARTEQPQAQASLVRGGETFYFGSENDDLYLMIEAVDSPEGMHDLAAEMMEAADHESDEAARDRMIRIADAIMREAGPSDPDASV